MSDYRVLSITLLNKKKYKISLEGTKEVILSLYPQELKRFNLKEGNCISVEIYGQICELLYKRGKERALYYLKSSDKTVYQIHKKLAEGYYPEEIIKKIILFLENYGYIDDLRYAKNFILYSEKRKSHMQIRRDLSVKGISKECIAEAFDNVEEEKIDDLDIQREAIRTYISKKITVDMDKQTESKIIMSMMRRGFKYDDIISVVIEEKNTRFSG